MDRVVLLSGGLDSAVALAEQVVTYGRRPLCLTMDYGQANKKELGAAAVIAAHYGCKQVTRIVPRDWMEGSALTGDRQKPEGLEVCDPSKPGQSAYTVPGRNLIFLSVAVAEAIKIGANAVIFACHKASPTVYQDHDNSLDFVMGLRRATKAGYGVDIITPLIELTKAQVAMYGRFLELPIEKTWSCYGSGDVPCGDCGACRSRAEALA